MFERLTTALLVGVPVGALSAMVLVPLARRLPHHLLAKWGASDPGELNLTSKRLEHKESLDWQLGAGLCLSPALALLNWGIGWFAVAAAIYCAILQVLARIDAQTRLLPDVLTLPLLWAGLLFHLSGGWVGLDDAVAGAAAGYGLLWLIWAAFRGCTGRDGIGFGDLKLAAANGAWLGLEAMPWALLVASLTGCLAACLSWLAGRLKHSETLAFGPYLAVGGILVLFCTQNRF